MERTEAGQKQVRKVTNMLMDGLGVMSMLMGCGKRQTGRQELVQDGGRQQTIGKHGNQKNQSAELSSTALKNAAARHCKQPFILQEHEPRGNSELVQYHRVIDIGAF